MTLRELVQQSGGINSPKMDYDLQLTSHNRMFRLDIESKAISNLETPENGSGKIYIDLERDQTLWLHEGVL